MTGKTIQATERGPGELELRQLPAGLTAVRDGDFGTRLPSDGEGLLGDIATVFNGMVDQLSLFTSEVTRVAREVGTEGTLGGQAEVPGVSGTWADLTDSGNAMAGNLTTQVRDIAQVATAVAKGDLSQKIDVPARGEILQLKDALPGPGSRHVPAARTGADPSGADADGEDTVVQVSPVGRLAATVERLRREVRAAQAEADGRALVELAKGILVERLGCGPAQAARQLAELTEQAGVTPLEFAVEVINQASRDRLSEVTNAFLAATTGRGGTSGAPEQGSSAVGLRSAESAALAAHDAQAAADSLLEHALTPLGAVAVGIWALGADGSLTLAGSAGFSPAEVDRWRQVPPGVATVARRGLTERTGQWIARLSEAGLPSIGQHQHPDGGRAAVPAGAGGRIHGVLEIVWPTPLEPQPPQIVRQIEALAELCAHTLETYALRGPHGHPGPRVLPDAAELMDLADGLHDPALVLVPEVDAGGHLVDFRIHHVNARFLDPAGRPRGVVSGALLLEAYPMAAGESGLFEQVYASTRRANPSAPSACGSPPWWTRCRWPRSPTSASAGTAEASCCCGGRRTRRHGWRTCSSTPNGSAASAAPDCAWRCATGPPRPSSWSAATGTTPSCSPPGWCCCAWVMSPDTASRRRPAWSSCATRCAGSPSPVPGRASCCPGSTWWPTI